MARFKSKAWKRDWALRPAWTASHLACLCCGWNPDDDTRPDASLYNGVLERIRTTVKTKSPGLPIIVDLLWADAPLEAFYGQAPLFRPTLVWRWAKARYPKGFPFSSEDFDDEEEVGGPTQLPSRLLQLLQIYRELPPHLSQKEVAAVIQKRLPAKLRESQAYAVLIRPDEEAARDGRASRRLSPRNISTKLSETAK